MTTPSRLLRSEGGLTLPEVLVAVVILGVSFTAILGAMATSIMGSDIHRKQASAGAALNTYGESVKGAAYAACATTSSYAPASVGYGAPAGYTASVTAVEFWRTSSSSFVASHPSCPVTDDGVQRITLSVASSDGRAVETLQVVKRTP